MDAFSCASFPASRACCGSPLPQLLPVPISAVCWRESAHFPANACLHTRDSRRPPTESHPPTYRKAAPPLSRPCVLATAFVRAVAFGQDRGRSNDATHPRKCGHRYPRPGRLGRMQARAQARGADKAPAEVPVLSLLGDQQKHGQRSFNPPQTPRKNELSILRKSHPQSKLAAQLSTPLGERSTESQAGFTAREAARTFLQPGAAWARGLSERGASMSAGTMSAGRTPVCKIKGNHHAGDSPAAGRTRTDLSQGPGQGLNHRIVHRNTNHLFDEGIKDVAGKSYDSRP